MYERPPTVQSVSKLQVLVVSTTLRNVRGSIALAVPANTTNRQVEVKEVFKLKVSQDNNQVLSFEKGLLCRFCLSKGTEKV